MSLLKTKTLSALATRAYHGRQQIGKREVVGYVDKKPVHKEVPHHRMPSLGRAKSSFALGASGVLSSSGVNGTYGYTDRADCPYPAVRWQEPGPHVETLLQKEKGDWKNLSIEDKKALYRHSFRQTFAEFDHPEGDWKFAVGGALIAVGLALWIHAFNRTYIMPPLPDSCSDEAKEAQVKRMIDIRANPVDGIASKWDYDNNRWK